MMGLLAREIKIIRNEMDLFTQRFGPEVQIFFTNRAFLFFAFILVNFYYMQNFSVGNQR